MPGGEASRRPTRCRSCGATLHGQYCSACGENHKYARLELRALLGDVLDGLLNLDTRALRTVGDLCFAPARVCRDYLDGRRVRYMHPFKYALATVALAYGIGELSAFVHDGPIPTQLELLLRWGPLINLLAMPLLAAIMLVTFIGTGRKLGWVEHYVVVLFTLGHVALLQGLLNPLVARVGELGTVAFGLLPIIYLGWVSAGVCEARWWSALLRGALSFVLMQLAISGVLYLVLGPALFVPG